MFIRIGFEIAIQSGLGTTLVLALSPHSSFSGRVIGDDRVHVSQSVPMDLFTDTFGNRLTRVVVPAGEVRFWSDCIVEVDGQPDPVNRGAREHPIAELPSDTLQFLTSSRYCNSDMMLAEAMRMFGHIQPGWARVQAITAFVHNHLTFGYGFGRSSKTASDALTEKTGVCRDFAQLSVALCRAMNVPARYASGYLGDIGVPYAGPGDFCAWFEVFLGGQWYTFDARYNTPRIGRVLMVRGRDAADGAMITSFGAYDLRLFRVWTDEVPAGTDETTMAGMLSQLPQAPALVFDPNSPHSNA